MTSRTSSAAGRKADVLSLTVEREQGFTVGGGGASQPESRCATSEG